MLCLCLIHEGGREIPSRRALVRDLRPFRSIAITAIKFGLYCKLVYICIMVKADCAAELNPNNNVNS